MVQNESVDATVNPQAQRPGEVEPERTPGSAPSVVPLPDGADPDAEPGEHPVPEEAIEGYPKIDDLYKGDGYGSGESNPTLTDAVAQAGEGQAAEKPSTTSTSSTSSTTSASTSKPTAKS